MGFNWREHGGYWKDGERYETQREYQEISAQEYAEQNPTPPTPSQRMDNFFTEHDPTSPSSDISTHYGEFRDIARDYYTQRGQIKPMQDDPENAFWVPPKSGNVRNEWMTTPITYAGMEHEYDPRPGGMIDKQIQRLKDKKSKGGLHAETKRMYDNVVGVYAKKACYNDITPGEGSHHENIVSEYTQKSACNAKYDQFITGSEDADIFSGFVENETFDNNEMPYWIENVAGERVGTRVYEHLNEEGSWGYVHETPGLYDLEEMDRYFSDDWEF